MTAVEQQLVVLLGLGQHWIHVLDGKPLAVSPISHDRDAAWGRGARGMQKGYKLHAVWNGGPLFTTWSLAPMNMSEARNSQDFTAIRSDKHSTCTPPAGRLTIAHTATS